MRNLIISTIGTSLLTNPATKEEQNELYKYSNCKENECPVEIKNLIEALVPKVEQKLNIADIPTLRKISAELNGILGFYNNDLNKAKNDIHFLICTDTYQGKVSADIEKKFFESKEIVCQIIVPKGLSTKNKESFSDGIKELLKIFDETLEGYKQSGFQIIFNLTGGFKSLQGYLNTIAMFYADKIIYIFESPQSELIEIPRLPIKINLELFNNFKNKLFLLNAGYLYDSNEFQEFPESAIDIIDNKVILSIWGEVIWNKVKYDLIEPLPSLPYLKYENSFIESYNSIIDKNEKFKLVEKLSKVSVRLIENNGDISILKKDGGFLYENYKSKFEGSIPLGHFRINDGYRISCLYKNNQLYLRKYGNHDFVNNNP